MSTFDTIIRGGTVVTHEGEFVADIAVADGKIAALDPQISGGALEELSAGGLHVLPGLIDSHVHFNDPGRREWEGIETGSRALAAGGGTTFFDMPLNAHPPTLDAASFDAKLAVAEATSLVDFGLWGGIVLGNQDNLEELNERGVVGFKAFMCNSGIEDFLSVNEATLREGMKRAAKLGRLVAVHAESEAVTSQLAQAALALDKTSIRDYLDSRPIQAELDAIQRTIQLAGETSCALHIVHVSCGAGVALVASAQKLGADVTCETCPHYLVLTEDDMLQLGAVTKCAPPLRTQAAQDSLWESVKSGFVATVGSDHSPSLPERKLDKNFFNAWGGISGVQHTLPLLITEGHVKRELALSRIVRLTSFEVAKRFNLPATKGRIAVGADADFALVDLKQQFTPRAEDLYYRHRQSPYLGRPLTGRVVRTMLRGQTVFRDGQFVSSPMGRLLKPVDP